MNDRAAWMAELGDKIKNTPLNELAIPGSHDSTTWGITSSSSFAADAGFLCRSGPWTCAQWAKTQNQTFAQQLQNGVRFFDVRISKELGPQSTTWLTYHSMFAANLVDDVLTPLKSFLATTKSAKEVVILMTRSKWFPGEPNEDTVEKNMVAKLLAELDGLLIPPTEKLATVTLAELWKDPKKRVILLYPGESTAFDPTKMWRMEGGHRDNAIVHVWETTSDMDTLHAKLDAGFHGPRLRRGFFSIVDALGADVYGVVDGMASGVVSAGWGSLESLVSAKRTEMQRWPWRDWSDRRANLISADFVEDDDWRFVDAMISLNLPPGPFFLAMTNDFDSLYVQSTNTATSWEQTTQVNTPSWGSAPHLTWHAKGKIALASYQWRQVRRGLENGLYLAGMAENGQAFVARSQSGRGWWPTERTTVADKGTFGADLTRRGNQLVLAVADKDKAVTLYPLDPITMELGTASHVVIPPWKPELTVASPAVAFWDSGSQFTCVAWADEQHALQFAWGSGAWSKVSLSSTPGTALAPALLCADRMYVAWTAGTGVADRVLRTTSGIYKSGSWSWDSAPRDVPDAKPAGGPTLSYVPEESRLLLGWIDSTTNCWMLRSSTDQAKTWTPLASGTTKAHAVAFHHTNQWTTGVLAPGTAARPIAAII